VNSARPGCLVVVSLDAVKIVFAVHLVVHLL
jgi:hypothetical protein